MSPLFHRRSEEEKAADRAAGEERRAADERSAERSAQSLQLIEAGRIPLPASERLRALAGADGADTVFTSDLGVSEWSALARIGVQPITQVMGSSIYQVGWQPVYYEVPTEIRPLSDAFNESRRLALGRLLEEAQTCGADAVVGVEISRAAHDWAAGAIEFVAMGTAVRLPPAMRDPRGTALSFLSGQKFTLLCEAGYRPVGIAAHTSVRYIPASAQTQRAQGGLMGSWANQELVDFSQGVYDARRRAVGFVTDQVRELGGDGVIGVSLRESARSHEVQRGLFNSRDLQVTFHVLGTVIREDPALQSETSKHAPLTILSL